MKQGLIGTLFLLAAMALALGLFRPSGAVQAQVPASTPVPLGDWQAVGLQGLQLWSLAISPNFAVDATLFAGTDGSGLFRSTDGGSSWQQVDQAFASLIVPAIALSPSFASDSTVFAGIFGAGAGLVRSLDGGDTWQQMTTTAAVALALSPKFATDSTLFADFGDGVYRSTDGGLTWQKTSEGVAFTPPTQGLPPPVGQEHAMAISPTYDADATIFSGMFGGGPFRSTDGGGTWQQVTQDLLDAWIPALAISPGFDTDSTVFAGTSNGVFRSLNGGDTWQDRGIGEPPPPPPIPPAPDVNVRALAVSPEFEVDATAFAGTNGFLGHGVYRSTDGGLSWQGATQGLTNTSVFALAISPDFATDRTIFAGTGDGVFRWIDVQQAETAVPVQTWWSMVTLAVLLGVALFWQLVLSPRRSPA